MSVMEESSGLAAKRAAKISSTVTGCTLASSNMATANSPTRWVLTVLLSKTAAVFCPSQRRKDKPALVETRDTLSGGSKADLCHQGSSV